MMNMASSALLKSLEKELSCSICTDLLFEPVTFLDCLHTNCGACSKRWFTSQASNSPTCPICREPVRETKLNPTLSSILEEFLKLQPDKKRSDEEAKEARTVYKPGDRVITNGVVVNSASPARGSQQQQQQQQPGGGAARSVSISVQQRPQVVRIGIGPSGNHHQESTGPNLSNLELLDFLTQSPTVPNGSGDTRRMSGQLNTLAELVQQNHAVNITCDRCASQVGDKIHYECNVCSLFHLCQSCYRLGRRCSDPTHPFLPQKQISTGELQTGVFCSQCESHLDQVGMLFCHCENCNGGEWAYCETCVKQGKCCSHPLNIYSNSRIFSDRVHGPSLAPYMGGTMNARAGYTRFRQYSFDCDLCSDRIPRDAMWLHCHQCANGEFDMCDDCSQFVNSSAPRQRRGRCLEGHEMAILRMEDGGGRMVTVKRPEVPAPEIVEGERGRRAMAVSANWPEEGEEGGLWFPAGAELEGVRKAWTEGDREWWWGAYAGGGGIFERRIVTILD